MSISSNTSDKSPVDVKIDIAQKGAYIDQNGADFETAIAATKFGKFNIFLFLLAIPTAWSNRFETTTMSYVLPAAECDLNLSLQDKGLLNAVTFLGMVLSGFIWGFLCDTLGRRKLIIYGNLIDSFLVIASSFSQNFTILLITKFLGGFIVNGPSAALATYLSEFHCSRHRTRVQLARGIIISMGTMALPLLAWAILPQNIHIQIFSSDFELHSWNLYLLVCALPSFISGVGFIFMPESPKFLMSAGYSDRALDVFKQVYHINTGLERHTFPISKLIDEKISQQNQEKQLRCVNVERTKMQALKAGFLQIKPLLFHPHLRNIFLVCTLQSLTMISHDTLRLWSPQIFQSISDYQFSHNGTTADLCTMLSVLTPNITDETPCFTNLTPDVYQNTLILSSVSISGFLLAGTIVNRIGKKSLVFLLSFMAGTCGFGIYWAQDIPTTLALQSLSLAMGQISGNVIVSIIIDLFPTTLRAVAISLALLLGRSAAMIGNVVFPYLLQLGCAPPFFTIGGFIYACCLFIVFLPNTDMKSLQ